MCLEFADKILIFVVLNGGFYNEEKLKPVFVIFFIILAVLLSEISKVDNVAYNSTSAYSVYGTFDTNINIYCFMPDFPFFKITAVRHLGI